ncbi:MAG TPA: amidase, partial [Lentzea sp.]
MRVADALARLALVEPRLCAFHEVFDSFAPVDPSLPLAGMPIAVKRGERESHREALMALGCVPIGLTTTPDGSTPWQTWGRNSRGVTRNPWNLDRT